MKKNLVNLMNKRISEIEIPDSIFGVKVFSISSNAIEKYENDQLIYFKS